MIYRFNDVEIDEATREVRHGGVVVDAEPKLLDVALYLIRNRDRVVGKDELLDALWDGRSVSESVMPRAIHAVRKLLGTPSAIKTLYRHGYRFVGTISVVGELAPPDERIARAPASHRPSAVSPVPESERTFIG